MRTLTVTAAIGVSAVSAAVPRQDEAVVAWLREEAVPLATVEAGHGFDDMAPVRAMVGSSRIVALGESTHGTREIFQMKHRMLEFLVEEKGFTLFGIEASYPDCVAINDYVQGGDGDPAVALHGQGFWTWDTEEVLAMIRWMRAYNDDPAHERRLHFYGFDMQNAAPALAVAIEFLGRHEPERARGLAQRLVRVSDVGLLQTYGDLPEVIRTQIEDAAEEAVTAIDALEGHMIGAADRRQWATARQHAVVMGQFIELARSWADLTPSIGVERMTKLAQTIGTSSASLLGYLDYVDADLADAVRPLLDPLSGNLDQWVEDYRAMNEAERAVHDRMPAQIVDALIQHRATYAIGVKPEAYDAARRAAADVVTFVTVCRERLARPERVPNVRDRAMAENVGWILDQHGPDAKIALWAHNGHVSHEPVAPGTGPMGNELERRFGDEHLVVGFAFNQGSFQAIFRPGGEVAMDGAPALRPFTVGPARPGSVDRVFAGAGHERFIVDLRAAPKIGPVAEWLRAPHPFRMIGAVFAEENERSFYRYGVLGDHYDLMIFIETTTRARPNELTRLKFGMPDPGDG